MPSPPPELTDLDAPILTNKARHSLSACEPISIFFN